MWWSRREGQLLPKRKPLVIKCREYWNSWDAFSLNTTSLSLWGAAFALTYDCCTVVPKQVVSLVIWMELWVQVRHQKEYPECRIASEMKAKVDGLQFWEQGLLEKHIVWTESRAEKVLNIHTGRPNANWITSKACGGGMKLITGLKVISSCEGSLDRASELNLFFNRFNSEPSVVPAQIVLILTPPPPLNLDVQNAPPTFYPRFLFIHTLLWLLARWGVELLQPLCVEAGATKEGLQALIPGSCNPVLSSCLASCSISTYIITCRTLPSGFSSNCSCCW